MVYGCSGYREACQAHGITRIGCWAGARDSANLCGLIETTKGHGLKRYAYLRHISKEPLAKTIDDGSGCRGSRVCIQIRSGALPDAQPGPDLPP